MPRIWQRGNTGERALIEWTEFRPVLSIIFIVATLLGLVFLQMEERRVGYASLKLSQKLKVKTDARRGLEIQLAQVTRLEKLESMAYKKLTLKRAQNHQVIYLNEFTNMDDVRREFSAADHERLEIKPDIRPTKKSMSLIARLTDYFPGSGGETR